MRWRRSCGIARIGRKKPDRVVAPVIGQALLQQVAVIDEEMDRQQLHRGDAQLLDVLDHRLSAEARIGAAQVLVQPGKSLGEALDVELINNRVVKRYADLAQHTLTMPIEVGIDHHALGHERRAVPLVEGSVVPRLHLVAEYRRVPFELADVSHRIGIEQ